MRAALLIAAMSAAWAAPPDVMVSRHATAGAPLTLDPASALWSGAAPVLIESGRFGEKIPGRPTEVRSRWTATDLYLLYTCPYERLHLKPDPVTALETNHLWDWDVAEAFIGTDFGNPRHYAEFEVSPQGEWVDLDIDRSNPQSKGIGWNSGFEARARIDREARVWYAAMRIPWRALNVKASSGVRVRINLYRIEGGPPARTYFTWRPTRTETFHTPESFGWLALEGGSSIKLIQ